jgi:hypothetical protein
MKMKKKTDPVSETSAVEANGRLDHKPAASLYRIVTGSWRFVRFGVKEIGS